LHEPRPPRRHTAERDGRTCVIVRGSGLSGSGADGSFPIRNREDLKDAIQSYGRAKDKDEAKRWIKRRARALNAEKELPEDW